MGFRPSLGKTVNERLPWTEDFLRIVSIRRVSNLHKLRVSRSPALGQKWQAQDRRAVWLRSVRPQHWQQQVDMALEAERAKGGAL